MNIQSLFVAAALAAAIAAPSHAQSPFYVVGGVGTARHSIDTGAINSQLINLGFTGAATTSSNDDTAYRLGAGWYATPNLAVEASYFNLGKPDFSATATRSGTFGASLKTSGFAIDLVPQMQFANGVGINGRLGYARTETKANFSASGAFRLDSSSSKERRGGWDAGVGVSYALSRNVTVRAEWTRFMNIGGDQVGGKYDADVYVASVLWRF